MLTKEQEKAIRDAINAESKDKCPYLVSDLFENAIFNAIQAYDKLQNKNTNDPKEEKPEPENLVVFKKSNLYPEHVRVFNSTDEMMQVLEEETGKKVYIGGKILENTFGWKQCREVFADSAFGYYTCGYFDSETFKKG